MSTVTRNSLRPKKRPQLQCNPCYRAGLPYSLSREVCADCKSKTTNPSQDRRSVRNH